MDKINEMIEEAKAVYLKMIATCDINIKDGKDVEYYKKMKSLINIHISELELLLIQ